jgi:hypothetical protein
MVFIFRYAVLALFCKQIESYDWLDYFHCGVLGGLRIFLVEIHQRTALNAHLTRRGCSDATFGKLMMV